MTWCPEKGPKLSVADLGPAPSSVSPALWPGLALSCDMQDLQHSWVHWAIVSARMSSVPPLRFHTPLDYCAWVTLESSPRLTSEETEAQGRKGTIQGHTYKHSYYPLGLLPTCLEFRPCTELLKTFVSALTIQDFGDQREIGVLIMNTPWKKMEMTEIPKSC